MSDPDQPSPDRLLDRLEDGDHEAAAARLDRLDAAGVEARKRTVRALRPAAEERPGLFEAVVTPLAALLSDEDRAVRLTTAKLFVTLARSAPGVARPAVDALADRLADEAEFYYVRARCAEALGYVAVDSPEHVTDPETLADLRVGLAFDEPEVRRKLAKALAHVALGDPSRLRHQVSSLADHLDDDEELVRYHLCTALVVIGCAHPEVLAEAAAPLRARLEDANPYVRGRAAEALGLLAASEAGLAPELDLDAAGTGPPAFLTDRLAFCRRQLAADGSAAARDGVGTVASVRDGTADVVEEMTAPDGATCPHCGLALPADGPPMCPRCGSPR